MGTASEVSRRPASDRRLVSGQRHLDQSSKIRRVSQVLRTTIREPVMPSESLADLLKRWQAGELDLQGLENQLRSTLVATAITPDAHLDLDRQRRCGYPEVVYAAG